MPKFQALFSLNVYDSWVLQGAPPLASYEENFAFGDLKMRYSGLFSVLIYKYDFGVCMPLT